MNQKMEIFKGKKKNKHIVEDFSKEIQNWSC